MQIHYNYEFDKLTQTYNFCTKNNILYKVAFFSDETFSAIADESIPNIYQIVMEKTNEGKEPFDPSVASTVAAIIRQFFKRKENSLIFICSDDDTRAMSRHRVFHRWYKTSELRDTILKIDNIIDIKGEYSIASTIYTSFLIHKENPNFHHLIKIYKQLEMVLNEDK